MVFKGMSTATIKTAFVVVILVTILAQALVTLLPSLISNITGMANITNMPFASMFAAGGVVLLTLGAGVVLYFVSQFLPSGKGK